MTARITPPALFCLAPLRLSLGLAMIVTAALTGGSQASAQSAGSWVDVARGAVGSGASASGPLQFATSKSSSQNGLGFGHGFAVGAGPNGIALSNSVGAGGGPLGVAHNVQLNIGPGGSHISHGGVVSEGGNRRVIAGGETGTAGGQVYGGSHVTGFGNNTQAYSKSRTRNWLSQGATNQGNWSNPTQSSNQGQLIPQGQPVFSSQAYQSSMPANAAMQPSSQSRVIGAVRTSNRGQVFTMGRSRGR